MSLAEKLDAIRANAAEEIPEPARELIHQATQELVESGAAGRIVGAGDKLPSFSLQNQYGDSVSSDALLDSGPLVLTVYRGEW
jgi:hypothetical protein